MWGQGMGDAPRIFCKKKPYFLNTPSLRVRFLGEPKNEFVIPDHMDSLPPIKRKIRKSIFFYYDKLVWRHTILI